MAQLVNEEEVASDFGRYVDHLLRQGVDDPLARIDEILDAIEVLKTSPNIGRPSGTAGFRELVTGSGLHGSTALYEYDPQRDIVYVVAARSQRELGFPRAQRTLRRGRSKYVSRVPGPDRPMSFRSRRKQLTRKNAKKIHPVIKIGAIQSARVPKKSTPEYRNAKKVAYQKRAAIARDPTTSPPRFISMPMSQFDPKRTGLLVDRRPSPVYEDLAVSCTPSARTTFITVSYRGFAPGVSALYRLSRPSPASLAT